jgi:hypothetical protein
MPLGNKPGRPGAGYLPGEVLPGFRQLPAEGFGAPIGDAFFDLGRREKQHRPGARQIPATALGRQFVDMGAAYGAVVAELAKAAVDALAQAGIAREVDVNTGRVGGDAVQLFIRQHAV